MASELMGMGFDYVCLPSVGALGGIVVAWNQADQADWAVSATNCRSYSVTVTIAQSSSPAATWTLSAVYGPVLEGLKPAFLEELREVHTQASRPLLLCGDFNQIYRVADKNNGRLNLRSMRRFHRMLDDSELQELYLHGKLYTWSSRRSSPRWNASIVRLRTLCGLMPSGTITYAAFPQTAPTTRPCCSTSALNRGQSRASALSRSGFVLTASTKLSGMHGTVICRGGPLQTPRLQAEENC